jgi:hypothetical protein
LVLVMSSGRPDMRLCPRPQASRRRQPAPHPAPPRPEPRTAPSRHTRTGLAASSAGPPCVAAPLRRQARCLCTSSVPSALSSSSACCLAPSSRSRSGCSFASLLCDSGLSSPPRVQHLSAVHFARSPPPHCRCCSASALASCSLRPRRVHARVHCTGRLSLRQRQRQGRDVGGGGTVAAHASVGVGGELCLQPRLLLLLCLLLQRRLLLCLLPRLLLQPAPSRTLQLLCC